MSAAQRIAEQYPFLASLINEPGMRALLTKAVDINQPYSPERFRAELMKTGWWRGQSETRRAWGIKRATDPATARNERNTYRTTLNQAAAAYGAKLSQNQLKWMTEVGLQRGWDPAGAQMMLQVRKLVNTGKARQTMGARRTTALEIQRMARRDYLDPMTDKTASRYGDQIARGVRTIEDVRKHLGQRALVRYPQFAGGLRQGYTMADLTDHYRQTIGEELDIDPDRIDLSFGKWSQVLGVKDKGSKKVRPMSGLEALQLARKDPRFWRTQRGRQIDADATSTVLSIFGQRKGIGSPQGNVEAF